MKGLLAGLVLGFVLGTGVTWFALTRGDEDGSPPPRPGSSGRSPRQDSEPEPPVPARPGDPDSSEPRPGVPAAESEPGEEPSEPPPTNPLHVLESWSEGALCAALLAVAKGEPPPPNGLADKLGPEVFAGILASRLHGRGADVPAAVVLALLESGDEGLRRVGALLSPLAEPAMPDRVRKLALEDPDPRVRQAAVFWISLLAVEHEEATLSILRTAMRDDSSRVRRSAVGCLGSLARDRPALAEWVVAATEDPDAEVRSCAILFLQNAGVLGADRALEILRSGEHDSDAIEWLAEAIAGGGRLPDALGPDSSPELVTALLSACGNLNEEAGLEAARGLSGKYGELLPLFQPEDEEDFGPFFGLAAAAGEAKLLRDVILSREQPARVRLLALEAGTWRKDTWRTTLEAARTVLRDPKSPARFRVRVVDTLRESQIPETPIGDLTHEILKETREKDSSRWVREAVTEVLAEWDE